MVFFFLLKFAYVKINTEAFIFFYYVKLKINYWNQIYDWTETN